MSKVNKLTLTTFINGCNNTETLAKKLLDVIAKRNSVHATLFHNKKTEQAPKGMFIYLIENSKNDEELAKNIHQIIRTRCKSVLLEIAKHNIPGKNKAVFDWYLSYKTKTHQLEAALRHLIFNRATKILLQYQAYIQSALPDINTGQQQIKTFIKNRTKRTLLTTLLVSRYPNKQKIEIIKRYSISKSQLKKILPPSIDSRATLIREGAKNTLATHSTITKSLNKSSKTENPRPKKKQRTSVLNPINSKRLSPSATSVTETQEYAPFLFFIKKINKENLNSHQPTAKVLTVKA